MESHAAAGEPDLNQPGTLGALFYTGFAAAGLLVFKPLIIGALIDDFRFSARQAGLVAGIEMLGIGTAAIFAVTLGARWDRQRVVGAGVVLGVVGCGASILWHTFAAILGFRLLAGFGSGLMASIVLASIGLSGRPERNFGLYFMANYTAAAVLFPLLPFVIRSFGAQGGYLFLAALLLPALATRRSVPGLGVQERPTAVAREPFPLPAAILSLSISLAYWIGNGGFWAFIERIGLQAQIPASAVAAILSGGQLASIAGALGGSLLHSWRSAGQRTLAAVCISIVSMALVSAATNQFTFAIAVFLFCFAWSSFLTCLGGLMAGQDRSGRIVALSVSSQTAGMAIGPVAAGALAGEIGYGSIPVMAIACQLVAFVLLVVLVAKDRRRAA